MAPYKRKTKVGFRKKLARAAKAYIGVGKKRTLNVPNIAGMARQVASMAQMINAEKKILSIGAANQLAVGQNVGQVNVNVSGALAFDLTPLMPTGSGVSDRTGNSIKLHSSYFQFQIQQQTSNTVAPVQVRIEMWANPAHTQDQSTILNDLYVANPFTGIIDYHSARNPDHFNDYTKIMSKVCYLPVDSLATQISTKQIAIPFKWNKGKGHHVRYTGTGSTNYLTDIQAGQVFLVYFASCGNSGAIISSLNVPLQGASSGTTVKMSYRHYYYDN